MTSDDSSDSSPARIWRPQVMRRLLAHYPDPRYLEVGVSKGKTFHQIGVPTKVGVDPSFRFDHTDSARQVAGTEYHQMTSDQYFGSVIDPGRLFDVIFLDGLHTVEQTLRDLLNALDHLQPQGVIVIDDVRPPSQMASLHDQQDFFAQREEESREGENQWMGDVFRLVYFIDTFCQQLSYRTIQNNHGQAVVWRKRRTSVTDRGLAEVGAMSFAEFTQQQKALRIAPFSEIVRELRQDLGLSKPAPGAAAGLSATT